MARGDDTAFAELFKRYSPAALGLATKILRDGVLAEEVLQDVFLAVWRAPDSYDAERGSVRSWLLTRVHHRAIDVVRRESAERVRSGKHAGPEPDREVEDLIEESWIESRRARVRDALTTLPDEQRSVIELTYFHGMTQQQAAAHAGLPLGTVKSRSLAAMRKLRHALTGGES